MQIIFYRVLFMKAFMPQQTGMNHVLRGVVWLFLAVVTAVYGQNANPQASTAAVPAGRQADRVVIIPIRREINQVTAESVNRRLDIAEKARVDAVVFELDTPGGQVDAALQICTRIKRSSIRKTTAWINPNAYSAGVFIALACDDILVSPACTMGDAAPIQIAPGKGVSAPTGTLRAKIESPILAEIIDSARRHGYDEKLVQSFVVPEMELWLVENNSTGDRLFVDAREYQLIFGKKPESRAIVHGLSGRKNPAGVTNFPGKLRPLFREIPRQPGVASPAEQIEMAQSLPRSRPELTEQDRGGYTLIEQVVDRNTLLTLKDYDILKYGLADGSAASEQDLVRHFGAKSIDVLDYAWSEKLTLFLTDWWVRGVLIVIMLIAGLVELSAPGVGLPGAIAAVCLVVLLAAPLMAGLAAWWEIAAIVAGVLLILAEMFVIPGFGIAGISGILLLFLGLVGTFIPNTPGHLLPATDEERNAALAGLATVLGAFFTVMVAGFFLSRHLGSFPIFRRLVLTAVVPRASEGGTLLTAMDPKLGGPAISVGDIGIVEHPLRPSGKARFGEDLLDVVTDEGFINAGEKVRVVSLTGFRVVVEHAPENEV